MWFSSCLSAALPINFVYGARTLCETPPLAVFYTGASSRTEAAQPTGFMVIAVVPPTGLLGKRERERERASERERERETGVLRSAFIPRCTRLRKDTHTQAAVARAFSAPGISRIGTGTKRRKIFRDRSVRLKREGNSCGSFVGQWSVNVRVRTGPCTHEQTHYCRSRGVVLDRSLSRPSPTWRCEASYSRLSSVQPEPRGFFTTCAFTRFVSKLSSSSKSKELRSTASAWMYMDPLYVLTVFPGVDIHIRQVRRYFELLKDFLWKQRKN